MDITSQNIDDKLFQKQMDLYSKIDKLIANNVKSIDADRLSVLTKTLSDLEQSIDQYKKDKQNRELFKKNNI